MLFSCPQWCKHASISVFFVRYAQLIAANARSYRASLLHSYYGLAGSLISDYSLLYTKLQNESVLMCGVLAFLASSAYLPTTILPQVLILSHLFDVVEVCECS